MFRKGRPCSPEQLTAVYRLGYVPLIIHKKSTILLRLENRFKKLLKKKKKLDFLSLYLCWSWTWRAWWDFERKFWVCSWRSTKWAHETKMKFWSETVRDANLGTEKVEQVFGNGTKLLSFHWMNQKRLSVQKTGNDSW